MRKRVRKLLDGKCYFCDEADYAVLDVHRIVPGCENGKYSDFNSLTVCANCHRRIHDGQITILGRYFCTSGRLVLHVKIGDEEQFL